MSITVIERETIRALSVTEVSAFSTSRIRSIAIVIKSAFDGSGTSLGKYLTLSVLAADDPAWRDFENRWKEVLNHFQVPYSHMHELASRDKDKTSPFYGWDLGHSLDFAFALLNIIGVLHRSLTLASLTISLAGC